MTKILASAGDIVHPVKIFLIEFDHHAKFGCHFSYHVHACRRPKNARDAWAQPLGGARLIP